MTNEAFIFITVVLLVFAGYLVFAGVKFSLGKKRVSGMVFGHGPSDLQKPLQNPTRERQPSHIDVISLNPCIVVARHVTSPHQQCKQHQCVALLATEARRASSSTLPKPSVVQTPPPPPPPSPPPMLPRPPHLVFTSPPRPPHPPMHGSVPLRVPLLPHQSQATSTE